jgi:hypothetical protein
MLDRRSARGHDPGEAFDRRLVTAERAGEQLPLKGNEIAFAAHRVSGLPPV